MLRAMSSFDNILLRGKVDPHRSTSLQFPQQCFSTYVVCPAQSQDGWVMPFWRVWGPCGRRADLHLQRVDVIVAGDAKRDDAARIGVTVALSDMQGAWRYR